MPDFRTMPRTESNPPRGAFVRFAYSAQVDGEPARPEKLWTRETSYPCAGPRRTHEPLVGQVWDGARGSAVWVVLPDGTARLVATRDCEVVDEAEALMLL